MAADRERIAFHEAGHAVVAIHERLGLRHISIGKEPECRTNWQMNRCTGSTAAAQARFYVAGYVADRRYALALAAREGGENEYDFTQALRLVDQDYLERLLMEAERIVATHWTQIEAVAGALLEREVLSAFELYKIIISSR